MARVKTLRKKGRFSIYFDYSGLFTFRFYLSSERFRVPLLRNLKPGMIPLANSWQWIRIINLCFGWNFEAAVFQTGLWIQVRANTGFLLQIGGGGIKSREIKKNTKIFVVGLKSIIPVFVLGSRVYDTNVQYKKYLDLISIIYLLNLDKNVSVFLI